MRQTMTTVRLWAVALLLMTAPLAASADDAVDIRHLMMATFDKPEAPLSVDPVTVRGDLAVAGWSQGDMGGRALLRREDEAWELSLCAGEALREPEGLAQLGLSEAEAETMAAAVVAAEATLDPALVAKFSSFDGVVTMSADGEHPAAGGSTDHGATHGG